MAAVVAKLHRESDPSDTTAAPGCGRFTSTLPILPPWVNPDIAGEPWCRRLEADFRPSLGRRVHIRVSNVLRQVDVTRTGRDGSGGLYGAEDAPPEPASAHHASVARRC